MGHALALVFRGAFPLVMLAVLHRDLAVASCQLIIPIPIPRCPAQPLTSLSPPPPPMCRPTSPTTTRPTPSTNSICQRRACACDLRLAAENALFRSGFIGAGLSGDFGGTWTLPRVVGPAKARDLYLLNEKVRAEEAVRIGLASKLIPARGDAFKAKVHEIALTLAASAPLALKRIKANLIDADSTSFAHHLDLEAERHGKCGFHGDAAEAGMAFLEKRVAHFTGVGQRKLWEASKL